MHHSYGLYPFFDNIITFDDFEKHKPDPEPYAKAVECFNLKPDQCIAVEDSKFGCKSAKSAGCYTIGVLNSFTTERLISADLILNTSCEVIEFLEILILES